MNKYNRGTSVLEILISVMIISLVLILMFTLLNQVRDDEAKSIVHSNYIINQSMYTKAVAEDIMDFDLLTINACSLADANVKRVVTNAVCLKLTYNNSKIQDNIGFLMVYKYNTRTGSYCSPKTSCDPKWVISYVRGYYAVPGNRTTWKATKTVSNTYPDDIRTSTPIVDFTGSSGSTTINFGTIKLPILNNNNEHYDISIPFKFTDNKFRCTTSAKNLLCNCAYSASGKCNTNSFDGGSNSDSLTDSNLSYLRVYQKKSSSVSTLLNVGSKVTQVLYEIPVASGITRVYFNKYSSTNQMPANSLLVQFGAQGTTSIIGNDSISVSSTNNSINDKKIVVKSKLGTSTIYTLRFVRNAESLNTLKTLRLGSGAVLQPAFKSEETNYVVNLSSAIHQLTFTCEATSSLATVSGCSNISNIPSGISTKVITVRAEDGTTKQYTIKINRSVSSDTRVKSIAASKGTLIKETESSYRLAIPNNNLETVISATPNDSFSKVLGTGRKVVSNGDVIKITVVSESNTSQVYTINVEKVVSNNTASTSGITVTPGRLTKVDDEHYTLEIARGQTQFYLTGPFGTIPVYIRGNSYFVEVHDTEIGKDSSGKPYYKYNYYIHLSR